MPPPNNIITNTTTIRTRCLSEKAMTAFMKLSSDARLGA
jgi:hypothetical protein